jgi:hypothetical protein
MGLTLAGCRSLGKIPVTGFCDCGNEFLVTVIKVWNVLAKEIGSVCPFFSSLVSVKLLSSFYAYFWEEYSLVWGCITRSMVINIPHVVVW